MAQHTLSRGKSSQKNGLRRDNINKIYTFPLPLVFFDPAPNQPRSVFSFLGLPLTNIENPHCDGYLDMITHSVWVVDSVHSKALWRRGFFGKGDLSRSEPSWLARQINIRQLGGKCLSKPESLNQTLSWTNISSSSKLWRDYIKATRREEAIQARSCKSHCSSCCTGRAGICNRRSCNHPNVIWPWNSFIRYMEAHPSKSSRNLKWYYSLGSDSCRRWFRRSTQWSGIKWYRTSTVNVPRSFLLGMESWLFVDQGSRYSEFIICLSSKPRWGIMRRVAPSR